MKKTLFSMLTILMLANVYCQKNDCKIKSDFDKFEEMTSYEGLKFKTSKTQFPVEIQFLKYSYKDKHNYMMAVIGNINGCVNKNAKISFILGNGDKMDLARESNKIDCGVSHIVVEIKKEDFEKLLSNTILQGRINYTDSREDFVFSEKGQKEFISNLQCIIDAK